MGTEGGPGHDQERVAENKRGVPGARFLAFGGVIEKGDLAEMTKAIEDGCETVNLDEW